MGQGVITHVERAIEQVFDHPNFPNNPAIELNCNRAADLDLAVGTDRIVYTSNCKVRLVDPAAPGVALDEVYLRNHEEDLIVGGPVGLLSPSLHPDPNTPNGSRLAETRVHWDERNQRFWIVAVEHALDFSIIFDRAWLHVAVSKSSSPNNMRSGPTGDWFTFAFDTTADFVTDFKGFLDRTTFDTDGETLFIAVGRDLEDPLIVSVRDMRSVLVALPTTPLLAGNSPPTPIWNLRLEPDDPMHPVPEDTNFHCAARTYDALPVPQTQYFLASNVHPYTPNPLFTGIIIGQLDPDGSGGWTYSSQELVLPPDAWVYSVGSAAAPPPTGSITLHGTVLFWSVVQRGGSLWAVQGILRNKGGPNEPSPDPSGRSVGRWYEIVIEPTGGFTLAQWGDIDPEAIYSVPGLEAFDPSISVNSIGDLAITYTISGPTTFPSLCMGWRFRSNPPGKLPYHTIVRPGVATLDHVRYWSDFSGTEVSLDGCAFWAHSLEAYDDGVNPTNPIDRYQSWTAELNVCDDDMWADFDGDAELTALDWVEFVSLFEATDRRADVNADRRHDLIDAERVRAALRR